jgi:hypothetical protein
MVVGRSGIREIHPSPWSTSAEHATNNTQHQPWTENTMTNRRDLLAAAALFGPLSFAMRSAQATDGEPQEPKATSKMADFLFVQNANHVTYADGKLTLVG